MSKTHPLVSFFSANQALPFQLSTGKSWKGITTDGNVTRVLLRNKVCVESMSICSKVIFWMLVMEFHLQVKAVPVHMRFVKISNHIRSFFRMQCATVFFFFAPYLL